MSFNDDLPNPTAEFIEGKEWRSRLRSGTNRLSVDLFKAKQQPYDRRPSSVDATNWYSAASSFSAASTGGGPAAAPHRYSSGGGSGFLAASGSMITEYDDDRGEVTYSPARLSFIAGVPSPACGGGSHGGYNHTRSQSDSATYGYPQENFQSTLIEKLYSYGDGLGDGPGPMEPPAAEEILMAPSRHGRNTSIFRSFEGWGFDAEDIHKMDPIEEREIEPEYHRPGRLHRFDKSISKAAYDADGDLDMTVADVDPLDSMDTSRSYVESSPLPIPLRLSRKRFSQTYTREQQIWKRRVSSLQSMHSQQSRQHSRQYSNTNGSFSNGAGEGLNSSSYRPSIVMSEIPMFDFSESEPASRNVSMAGSSIRGSIFGGRDGSFSAIARRKSSKLSKKSISSSSSSVAAVNGSHQTPEKEKRSFFSFLSRKPKAAKPTPTSQARFPETQFVPLLHDIAEVSSSSSRGQTPEIMTTPGAQQVFRIRRVPDNNSRILPVKPYDNTVLVERYDQIIPIRQYDRRVPVKRNDQKPKMRRPEFNIRKASMTLRVEDDEVFDNPAPVAPHGEIRRSSSSIYLPIDPAQLQQVRRRSSSIYGDENLSELDSRIRRSSSVYDNDGIQPGEQLSPPISPVGRYSETHLSHPDAYVPPRANWYKPDWGLDDCTTLDAEAKSITSHAVGAVKMVLSRGPSRRGSEEGYGSWGNGSGSGSGYNFGRKKSEDERMTELSVALRDALKMSGIRQEDEFYTYA
ncbi:hypothetical protein ABW20_dc0108454 [Dactylellina cionopaga]|nr:hypothetical protein ABW20_dc0108454 [Dactylellina cionopaga]